MFEMGMYTIRSTSALSVFCCVPPHHPRPVRRIFQLRRGWGEARVHFPKNFIFERLPHTIILGYVGEGEHFVASVCIRWQILGMDILLVTNHYCTVPNIRILTIA